MSPWFGSKSLRQYVFVVWALLLTGCGEDFPELSIDTVSIYAEPDANQNSAIAVDLVLVYNVDLAKTIGQMTAAKYFESANQLLLDNPTLLDVWHWELVPGQIVENFAPSQDKGDANEGFVFANYLTPGPHRIKVAPDGIIKILLLKDDLKNLAKSNTHDVNVGATATDLEDDKEGSSALERERKIGPVTKPCTKKTRASKHSVQIDSDSSDEPSPCLKKTPVRITPLPPPSRSKPCKPRAAQ